MTEYYDDLRRARTAREVGFAIGIGVATSLVTKDDRNWPWVLALALSGLCYAAAVYWEARE